jgi:hypothetical protein
MRRRGQLPKFPTRSRTTRAELSRTLIASTALTAVFVTAFALGAGRLGNAIPKTFGKRTAIALQQQDDDDLTTGSIVFVPVLGNDCRKNVIDNATWHVREVGTVPCDKALAESRRAASANSRLSVISESFRGPR